MSFNALSGLMSTMLSEGVSGGANMSLDTMGDILTTMLSMGTTLLNWCVSTFPINVAIAGGVIGIVIGVIRKSKRVGN